MWVSKKRFQQLVNKVDGMERDFCSQLRDIERQFEVWDWDDKAQCVASLHAGHVQRINMQQICDFLELRASYCPAYTKLEKKAKK